MLAAGHIFICQSESRSAAEIRADCASHDAARAAGAVYAVFYARIAAMNVELALLILSTHCAVVAVCPDRRIDGAS